MQEVSIADCSVVIICLLGESECTAVHWLSASLLDLLVMHLKKFRKTLLNNICMLMVQTIMFVKHSLAGRPCYNPIDGILLS
jgi:hypothetical protein